MDPGEEHFRKDEIYRSAKTVHSKWTHQTFEAEIASKKDRLYHIQQSGEQLINEKNRNHFHIKPRIQVTRFRFHCLSATQYFAKILGVESDVNQGPASVGIRRPG